MRASVILALAVAAILAISHASAEDAYIESSGAQSINTGYRVNSNTRLEVDFEIVKTNGSSAVFGAVGASGTACMLWCNSNRNLEPLFGDWLGGFGAAKENSRRTVVFDMPEKYVKLYNHGSQTPSGTKTGVDNGTADWPLALFADCQSANGMNARRFGTCRIYSFKIYEKNAGDYDLVHDFVPYVKGDAAGFRDAVNGTFHTSEFNVDGLSAGGDVERVADDGYVELTGNDGTQASGSRGGHYINTGYIPGPNTRIELDYAFAANRSGSGDWIPISAGNPSSGSKQAFGLWCTATFASLCLGEKLWYNIGFPAQTNVCHVRRTLVFDAYNHAFTVLTSGYANFAMTNSDFNVTQDMVTPIYLGDDCRDINGTSSDRTGDAPIRVYGLKIYESDALVREYVPCVENGAPGLKYGDTFVKVSWNATDGAVGMPRVGGNVTVSSDRDRDAYVLFSGAQSIDTGYHANGNSKFVVDFSFVNGYNKPQQQFVFSSTDGIVGRIYTNESGGNNAKYAWTYSKTGNFTSTEIYVDHQRRLFTIDAVNNQVRMTPGGYNGDSKMAGLDNDYTCSTTMRIGSNVEGNGFYAKIRLYRFTIYDGSEKVREFVPCVTNGVAGLYDIVGNEMFTSPGLEVGGRGYDSAEEWIVSPVDCAVKIEETKTLKAIAVGATRYKWTKNGESVVGGESGELTVEWVSGGRIDLYTVTPVYDVFGAETDGTPVPFGVKNAPVGMLLFVR